MELPLTIRKDLAEKGFDVTKTFISHGELEGVKYILDKLKDNDVAIFCCQAELEAVANHLEEISA